MQGHFIEVQVSEGALYRTKIHCYFLDQSRVIRPLPTEKNYHIFYQVQQQVKIMQFFSFLHRLTNRKNLSSELLLAPSAKVNDISYRRYRDLGQRLS
jgi:hypothetical protein